MDQSQVFSKVSNGDQTAEEQISIVSEKNMKLKDFQ